MPGALAVAENSLDQVRCVDRRALGLAVAHKVYVRHDRLGCLDEAGGKILQQKARPAVLVRLKDTKKTPRLILLPQRLERRANLRRMMSIIVHDDRAAV